MATSDAWSIGYARQAHADFNMFQFLQNTLQSAGADEAEAIEWCHRLQFLQMACEKLAKAHLCGESSDPANFQASHAHVAGKVPDILQQTALRLNFGGREASETIRLAKQMAREIEILAPAVKRGGQRPDNCEYPWEDGNGVLLSPLDWNFAASELLFFPRAPTILKLIKLSIQNLLR